MSIIHVGNCLDVMPTLQESSIDAIVCDPPYGLGFMGKDWDHGVPGEHFWREALRVAKPGAHLVAFGGTRTFHRLACAIEDAGWEIRDTLMWVYGSGFPKSLDVAKAIDKAEGHWRGKAGDVTSENGAMSGGNYERTAKGVPITAAAAAWEGWGTALKPAWEPIILARKPLTGTVAANVQRFGTGAMNIDGCRVSASPEDVQAAAVPRPNTKLVRPACGVAAQGVQETSYRGEGIHDMSKGRWPANLLHDGSEEVVALFPDSTSIGHTPASRGRGGVSTNGHAGQDGIQEAHHDIGSAARFFYTAKADREDRNWGCEGMEEGMPRNLGVGDNAVGANRGSLSKPRANIHPTVKPHELMRWLCRLVTQPGGLILDPFCGSGSTGRAALAEGFRFVGIELDPAYAAIAEARINATQPGLAL